MNDVYTLCLARHLDPYTSWPAVCIEKAGHEGDHRAPGSYSSYPGTGETWQ